MNVAMRRGVRKPDGLFSWNGREDNGQVAPDGVYYFRVALIHQGRTADIDVCWAPSVHAGEDQLHALAESVSGYEAAGITFILIESQARGFDACLTELELLRDYLPHPAPR